MHIVSTGLEDLREYETIPIAFLVESRLDLSDGMSELPVNPYWKDYDQFPDSRPSAYPRQFDTSKWIVLLAREGQQLLGGCMVAWGTDFEMLEGRIDLAVLVDLRVRPECRSHGVGRALFEAAVSWSTHRGCHELRVETQDTNVPACRFYSSMGCSLRSIEQGGYGPAIDEAKLIWSIDLS